MVNYKQELNCEQLNVVENGDGPCLVLAGAGSGKTRAIIYRVAYLLESGVPANNILLVTFTNKAAAEMTNRVKDLLGGDISLPWSGTFHHIGYRILRRYAPLIGYKSNFTILDSQDSLDLLKLCLKFEGMDKKERRYPSAKIIQAIISFSRNAERNIEDVLDEKYPNWLDISDKILSVASEYSRRKAEANAMDFDDLLVNWYLLLCSQESVLKKLSAQFQYILVDEYQDTNKIQASIIKALASRHKNILVVGDDAQSIYSFRAADIANILQFETDYPNTRIFKLETNYRSTPDILNVANVVIENNINQYKKDLKSVLDKFTKPELRAFADGQEEANFIADRILELYEEGLEMKKMAVLFRAAYHSQALEVELTRRDIPYEFRGGVRFFERSHIKDVLAYLRVYNNSQDEVAWSRVLNMQVGIGPASAQAIISRVKNIENENEIKEIYNELPFRAKIGWNDFLQTYNAMEAELVKEPSALIQAVIQSKYKEYLESEYPDARDRIQDLEQLALFAEKQTDLGKFLAEASLQESFGAAKSRGADYEDDKIVLSTIHQAKGLEWESVFVISMNNGQFPSDRSMKEIHGVEEERRLFYVAITRAKKYLYFTYSLSGSFGSYMSGPSIFLEEIDSRLLDASGLEPSTFFNDDSDDVVYVSDDEPFNNKLRTSFLSDISEL